MLSYLPSYHPITGLSCLVLYCIVLFCLVCGCGCTQVFGENMAILSGDALLVYAFEHIARDTKNVSAERVVRVVQELARASGGLHPH